MQEVGEITHFFGHIKVAVVEVKDTINKGDKVTIKGHTTDFEQTISSMQVDHNEIETAKKGQEIGMKVDDIVRRGDKLFKA